MRRIPLLFAAAAALVLPSNAAASRPPLLRCDNAHYSYVERGTHQHVDATVIHARSTTCQRRADWHGDTPSRIATTTARPRS